jgi:uncharacterized protein
LLYFSWDPEKEKKNFEKHGVSFEEAESVFDDPNGILISDEGSYIEDRFILLGLSAASKVLVVVHC